MSDQNNQIDIELPEDIAEGTYANLAIISHSNAEFIVDFVRIMPGVPKGKVKTRIILTPQHTKRLLYALRDNVKKFENTFGEIELNEGVHEFPMNFGPAGEA